MPLTSSLGVAEASVIEEALFTQGCFQRATPVSWLWATVPDHLSPWWCKATFPVGAFLFCSRS